MDYLKLEILSAIAETTRRRVLENEGRNYDRQQKNTWILYCKWDRPLHQLQEDTGIFQAGDVVYSARYLNIINQAHHWYNQITIKTVVCVQHFLAANIDLKKPSWSIKLPNTCNRRDKVQKGAMKLPDCLHKSLLDEIMRRSAVYFIEHEKYGH